MIFNVNMATLKIKVWLLLGFLAFLLNQTYGELRVVINASVSEGCLIADKSFLSLVQLSINHCAAECFLRPKCMSLKYKRRFNLCELLEVARDEPLPSVGQDRGGCVYVRKSDIQALDQVPNVCDSCVTGEKCDIENPQCVQQECHRLNVNNGYVLGNMNTDGSRVKYSCNPGYVRVSMQNISTCDNGMWNPFPMCLADQSTLTNAALGKPTSMSSTSHTFKSGLGVDGDTNQMFSGNSCFHTLNESRPWWQVDIQAVYNIFNVRMFNRADCCEYRTMNVVLLLGRTIENMVAVQYKEGQIDSVQDFNVTKRIEARYVKLMLNATNCFHLCEVQVFGKLRVPTIGGTCMQDSDCLETAAQCIFGQGAATGKCFCNKLYRYNSTSRDCERVCATIVDSFDEYQHRYILGYSTIANSKIVSSVDECSFGCVSNRACMFFEIFGFLCSIGTVSVQMINETYPEAFVPFWYGKLYSRSCT